MPTESDHAWFADDSFWASTYEFMFPPARIAAAPRDVDAILGLTGIAPPGPVLDLACGPGRHSVAFAGLGYTVTGVDRSPFLLGKAEERAREAGARIEWVRSDMREFVRPSGFRLAVSLLTSFGYFEDDRENRLVMRNVAQSLVAGGVFVLDMVGKEVLARIYQDTGTLEAGDELLVQRRTVTDDWSRMNNEWHLVRDGRVVTYRLAHWIYSARELKEMLGEAGFDTVRVFGDFAGSPYDHEANRLVAVATKAG